MICQPYAIVVIFSSSLISLRLTSLCVFFYPSVFGLKMHYNTSLYIAAHLCSTYIHTIYYLKRHYQLNGKLNVRTHNILRANKFSLCFFLQPNSPFVPYTTTCVFLLTDTVICKINRTLRFIGIFEMISNIFVLSPIWHEFVNKNHRL